MVRIPNIKIPSVRVGSIVPTSNIGTSGATSAPPTPITYLTRWKIVGNSEVHTLPYPDGVVLPTGYKRCEYLQSDGTAYIEVPFGFNKTDEVYAKAAMLDFTKADKYFVSPKVWNNANNRFAMGMHRHAGESNNPYWCCAYGNAGTSATFLEPHAAPDTNEHIWQYKNYKFTLDDGSHAKKVNTYSFGNETDNLHLFYGHNTPTECKICEYRHKKANAEYRLIPCLDSNDTPCMYDVINNQAYYNSAGSGSFTYKLYPQPTEIWSCGEYNATDGKYHILVQPLGGSIVDIALTKPLRKVNNVADSIEFPSETEGKALVTRNLGSVDLGRDMLWKFSSMTSRMYSSTNIQCKYVDTLSNILCSVYNTVSNDDTQQRVVGISTQESGLRAICVYDDDYNTSESKNNFVAHLQGVELIYELATPTTELVDAPQIEEAESYTCEISQGAKAVEWSSFTTNSE